jgi:hypothetical protein
MLRRTTGVRKMLVVLVMVAALAAGAAADRDHSAKRVSVPGRLSVRVSAGWHLVHGWLSDVTDPAPRLAIASFPARLSPHTCECGFPNVVDLPHNGAFVFVWEYSHYPRRQLARVPRRPVRFSLAVGKGVAPDLRWPQRRVQFQGRRAGVPGGGLSRPRRWASAGRPGRRGA